MHKGGVQRFNVIKGGKRIGIMQHIMKLLNNGG